MDKAHQWGLSYSYASLVILGLAHAIWNIMTRILFSGGRFGKGPNCL